MEQKEVDGTGGGCETRRMEQGEYVRGGGISLLAASIHATPDSYPILKDV